MNNSSKESSQASPLGSALAGLIAFFISGLIVAALQTRFDFSLLGTLFAGGLGGLILGMLLIKLRKIVPMTLIGLISVPLGFWTAFLIAGGLDILLTPFGIDSSNLLVGNILNSLAIVIMGLICSGLFGRMLSGRGAGKCFAIVGALASVPSAILVGLFNAGHPILGSLQKVLAFLGPIDLNFVTIITGFGLGIGWGIGLLYRNTAETL